MIKHKIILDESNVDLTIKPTKENTYALYKKAIESKDLNDFVRFWVRVRNLKVYFPARSNLRVIHKEEYIREEEILNIKLLEYTYPLEYLKGEHWAACFSSKEEAELKKPKDTIIYETRFLILYLYYLSYVDAKYVDGLVLDPFNDDIILDKANMKNLFKLEMGLIDYFNKNKIDDSVE